MSDQLLSILVLVAIFAIGTTLPVQMGVLGLVAAWIVGTGIVGQSVDDIFSYFPGDLFVTLVGVTYLFAIANGNGTVNWLIQEAVELAGGRVVAIPWVMFLVTALLTGLGSVVPAAVAIIAPIGLGFALAHKINPVLMGLLIINGATAGGFSPLSVFGTIVNQVSERNDLAESPITLFLSSLIFNLLLSIVVFVIFGGRELMRRTERVTISGEDYQQINRDQVLTLVGLLALVVGAVGFELEIGFLALTVAAVLVLVARGDTKNAVGQVAWPTVLLICGIVTYVTLLEEIGTVEWLGEHVAGLGSATFAGLLICYIGGAVSAFASTTGILGTLVPLAVPVIETGGIGAVALIVALSISSSVVDSSPFSTSGALVVANTGEEQRDFVFRRLMQWGLSMVAIAPLVAWTVFILPGWL
jgi:di/tricarboxylate transporter